MLLFFLEMAVKSARCHLAVTTQRSNCAIVTRTPPESSGAPLEPLGSILGQG